MGWGESQCEHCNRKVHPDLLMQMQPTGMVFRQFAVQLQEQWSQSLCIPSGDASRVKFSMCGGGAGAGVA